MHEKKCATEEHKKEVEEVCSSTKEDANTQHQMCQIETAEASAAIASTTISTLVTTATATTTSSTSATVVVVVAAASKSSVTEVVANTRVIKEPPTNYCNRRSWVTTDRMNELRRKAQEAVKQNKTFTIRGCFNSVRNALIARGWVEKLDVHRKHVPTGICQVTFEDLAQGLPKRKPGETRRQYIAKCERNIMSRFLEHMPIDFLWTNRKEKCDFIDQAKNPGMTINKFHRAPFTSKEGLCSQLKDFHWYYEEGTAEMYFPRCFNVWSPEELGEFVENFKLTACMAFVRWMVNKYNEGGFDAIFSPAGKIPFSAIDFAYKRCAEYINCCQHNDIDIEDPPRIWDHDWDAFLNQHYQAANENGRILSDPHRIVENIIRTGNQMLENLQHYWPQHSLEGYQNLWIIKPANKCRGRGIQLMDNLKRILTVVNPSIASKSRYVVQKYIERPLIIHSTKFDIRQWFLITNVQPLVVWMYKESYLRFSSQEYSLTNHHESVHLTNHAIQKKYTNGKRDKRLPIENMWDCYSFQAYLRQIGKQQMWLERIYPGMRKAIVGTMLASQENMDRRPNTFELFGADFMITEDFHPWLIEINSSPDLGATTSVTARMCPQCLEDVIKVVIDRRADPKADLGNFELIYRQVVPPTPAYMGLNLFIKGKQLVSKVNHHHGYHYHRRERSLHTSNLFKQRTPLVPSISNVHRAMPTFNATEYIEKCIGEAQNSSRSSTSGTGSSVAQQMSPMHSLNNIRPKLTLPVPATSPCPNLLKTPLTHVGVLRRSLTTLSKASAKTDKTEESNQMTITNSNKRHRSCGPRLSTLPNSIERNFKFIIKKCTLQGNAAFSPNESSPDMEIEKTSGKGLQSTSSESLNKADKRLMDLLNRANAMVNASRHSCRIARLSKSSPPTQEPNANANAMLRSQSCFVERKQVRSGAVAATGRCSGNDIKRRAEDTKTTASNETDSTTQVNGGSSNKTQTETTSSIHAIGKGLVTWKSSKRQTATSHKVTAATGGGGGINTAQTLRQRNFNITRRSSKFSDQAAINRNTRC